MSKRFLKTETEEPQAEEEWDVNAAIEKCIRFAKLEEDPKWKEESLKRLKDACECSPFSEEEIDRLLKDSLVAKIGLKVKNRTIISKENL